MKFEKHDLSEGMRIPAAAMKLSGFGNHEEAEYFTLQDAVVVLKKRMSALELIRSIWSLHQICEELMNHLVRTCSPCDGCGTDCEEERCSYDVLDFALPFNLPEELLERAGIPKGTPLHMEIPDDGELLISVNRDGPGLWDVPTPIFQGLLDAGICVEELEDLLETGVIVYGD